MRLRPLFWFVVSISCFLAGLAFWRLGDKWAGASSPGAPVEATNVLNSVHSNAASTRSATNSQTGMWLLTDEHNLAATDASSLASQKQADARRTSFRLKNSQEPISSLLRNPSAVLLENAFVDTSIGTTLAIPDHLRSEGDPGTYIVQSKGALSQGFRNSIIDAGLSVVSYIPNNAYLVRGTAAAAKSLESLPQTRAVLPYEPYYKLRGVLLRGAVEQLQLPPSAFLNVLLFPDAREQTLTQLREMGVQVLTEERSPFGPLVMVRPLPGSLPRLASISGVQQIDRARPRAMANDLSRVKLGVATDAATNSNYLGLSGKGILVNVNDTGVDTNHPALRGRIFGDSQLSLSDTNGHGTHIAGIIAGDGAESASVNAQGSPAPVAATQFRGLAHESSLYSLLLTEADAYLQEAPARTNIFVSNNSWYYVDARDYDLAAASYDAAVRDAVPEVSGAQPVAFVFAVGNGGRGNKGGTAGARNTVLSPATAKNVISVGATEQLRDITNTVVINGETNQVWAQETDSDDQVAYFSSRGNTGYFIEEEFGRFKPDLVAPGAFVVSTRSTQMDTNVFRVDSEPQLFRNASLSSNQAFGEPFFVPANAVRVSIQAVPNRNSPIPFPGLNVYADPNNPPPPGAYSGINFVTIDNPTPVDTYWNYSISNATGQQVVFDILIDVWVTNETALEFERLNQELGTYYRYESGSSQAAAKVSGMLALMQEFFEQRLGKTNSPALMKALLINGARSLGNLYDFQVTNEINFQGWGIPNLPNSIHGGLATPTAPTNSMFLVDQSPTNALATGDQHTYKVTLSEAGRAQPLRVTLVWTDPPGNPAAGVKLVNNLDLIVTNLETSVSNNVEVYYGNTMRAGSDYTRAWQTNEAPSSDIVNNVENIYLGPTLSREYSITVLARQVNVNAVTGHSNNVAQDYALVISSGDGVITNAISFQNLGGGTTSAPWVTIVTNDLPNSTNYLQGRLERQRVGANSPLLGTNQVSIPLGNSQLTVGTTNQWRFYTFTNAEGMPYLRFRVSASINLALPRMGARDGAEDDATREQPDLDLYVTRDSNLTNLVPVAISNAVKSYGRLGTEAIYFTNAVAGPYYAGVKSEDQMAGEYTFEVTASKQPFALSDDAGNQTLPWLEPTFIPDGTPERPGVMGITLGGGGEEILVRRVIVTNVVSHELFGDLIGVLSYEDGTHAILNNHSQFSGITNQMFVYDDSGEGDIPLAQPTDGPGSLLDFGGKRVSGTWNFRMIDNSFSHVGTNEYTIVWLEKQQDMTAGISGTLPPGRCTRQFVEVGPQVTALEIDATLISGSGPLGIQVCPVGRDDLCVTNAVIVPGTTTTIRIDQFSNPPLIPGVYRVILCNLGGDVARWYLLARLSTDPGQIQTASYVTNPVVMIKDDGVTYSQVEVNRHMLINSIDVGMLLNHPRISDLAITLISPNGTRVLLSENRGAWSDKGMGGVVGVVTNDAGLPVYAVTNMVPVYTNDFEKAAIGRYAPTAMFQGWTVLSNSVDVVPDYSYPWLSNNILVLGDGVVSNTLPTTNATAYRLQFRTSHAPYLVGTVGWWPLDGDAEDIFGGWNGLLFGGGDQTNAYKMFQAGKVNRSFYGDGVRSGMYVPAAPELDLGKGRGFTVETWIKPDNTYSNTLGTFPEPAPIFEWLEPAETFTNLGIPGVQFWVTGLGATNFSPGALYAGFWNTNGSSFIVGTSTNGVTNGGWQHVAMSYDSATRFVRLYVNGSLVTSQAVGAPGFVPRTSGDLYLGFHPDTITNTASFRGGLDEFGLYSRALSDCEVNAIFLAGAGGKYGTNVLSCPVTNSVELITGTSTTYTFTHGLAWTNGPQWETVTIDFTNPLYQAVTNGPGTNLASVILRPLDPNVAVDDFVLSALVTNLMDGLMRFSENTNEALVPMKFAPWPYTTTASQPVLVFSNDFEAALPGRYLTGASLPGIPADPALGSRPWTVSQGPITVVSNSAVDVSGTNWIALARGAIQTEIPTVPGRKYELSYSVRGPGAVGWWNGTTEPLSRRALDLIGGNHGALISGATNDEPGFVGARSLFFNGRITNNLASKIELSDPDNLRLTNALTIEAWINPSRQTNYFGTEMLFFRGDDRACLDPFFLSLEPVDDTTRNIRFHIEDGTNRVCGVDAFTTDAPVNVGEWQHVAAVFEPFVKVTDPPFVTNQLRIYLNGTLVASNYTGMFPFRNLDANFYPGVAIGNQSRNGYGQPYRGYIDELSLYGRALTEPELTAIWRADRAGKGDLLQGPTMSLAKVRLSLNGVHKETAPGDNGEWTFRTVTFIAERTNTVVALEGVLPGTLINGITLSEVPNGLTYKPEEDLTALIGEDAFGTWTIEILDNRVGATNLPMQLVSWELVFQLRPVPKPSTTYLSHGIISTNTVLAYGTQDFIVEVPQWALRATNVLQFATNRLTGFPANLSIFHSTNGLPVPLAGAPLIGPAFTGVTVLTTNAATSPFLTPGQTYFLTVTNPNPTATTFALGVWYDIEVLTNCVLSTNFVRAAGIPRYFQFDVPTNTTQPRDFVLWLSGVQSNVNVALSQHLPLPDLAHYDYLSRGNSTNNEVIMVLTNSTPWPLISNRWYVGVFNTESTNVPFSIQVCYQTSTNYPTLVPLTNDVPYVASLTNRFVAPPGPPQWFFFEFEITNFVDAVLFELYNLSGDLDLTLQRHLPSAMAPYFDGSFELGLTPEQIVLRTSYQLPDLRGKWYLGVYNNELTNVAYTIRASLPTNTMLNSALPLASTITPSIAPHGRIIQWNAVVGEVYYLEFTPRLRPPNWQAILEPIIPTTTTPAVELPISSSGSGFYRVVHVPRSLVFTAPLTVQRWGTDQLRISWPLNFPNYTLQFSVGLTGIWQNANLPVTIEGSEYVVYDTLGSVPKFYRLIP